MMELLPSECIGRCIKVRLDEHIARLIDGGTVIVTIKKGEIPIHMGQKVDSFYFVLFGLVRGYYIDERGNEVTKCFVHENGFFGSECYRKKGCSSFFVDCLEDCKCIKIPYALVGKVTALDRNMERFVQEIYLEEVGKLEDRSRELLLLSAEERYLFFCREYPSLQKRVPLKYIASYIGIQPGSMSRIRKKLKNQI